MNKNIGERWVHGLQQAFNSLAGVIGSGEYYSNNVFHKDQSSRHVFEARDILHYIVPEADNEQLVYEIKRLLPVVHEFFSDIRIRLTVKHLAEQFVKVRCMNGAQVSECISHRFGELDKAYQEQSAVAA